MSALVSTSKNELANPLLRARCGVCKTEVSFQRTAANSETLFQSLLENRGWQTYPGMRCPECVNKRARKILEKL